MLNLADLLGLQGVARREFLFEIDRLEKKIHGGSVSAEILGRIYKDSSEILRKLNFIDNDVLAGEIFSALKNKLIGEEILVSKDDFWGEFEKSVVISESGVISANKKDLQKSLEIGKLEYSEFRKLLKSEISEKLSNKIPSMSIDKINKLLYKEKE